jgi:asparagine synthase (glutamine-hydrolysing)
MCGIVGICSLDGSGNLEYTKCVKQMADVLQHRGPDDEGFLAADSVRQEGYLLTGRESKVEGLRIEDFKRSVDLFFGHKRLSIIDLSPAGHQPMCNENGQIWIVYNGEIYNYLEVRRELESLTHRFKSQTDTEVILHAYEEWGTDCLTRFNGMWSFAIADLRAKRIFCSRDRMGVKPFYYTYDGKRFCFASEIKAILNVNGFSAQPNEQMIADYLFLGLLDHTDETLFKDIYQLKPGQYLLIERNGLIVRSYWDIEPGDLCLSRDDDYAERFYELLKDSIRLRLRSDVPVGTCLSGGLDSSSIVCLVNRLMLDDKGISPAIVGKRQKTFSSCFEDHIYDERKYIELVAKQTAVEKNYVFPKGENLEDDIERLVWHHDEPFGSTGIYAQWEVMKLAKECGVTVLLDGQGGDELLGGYLPSFYYLFREEFQRRKWRRLWRELKGFRRYHPTVFTDIVSYGFIPRLRNAIGRKIDWAQEAFKKKFLRSIPRPSKFENDLDNYLYHCFRSTTLPRLLHYEDRNSMAFSLEARLPFLDFRLVEYIFSLPSDQKIREGITKVILRNAMKRHLPDEVRNRHDKMGFVTPDDVWFKTVLKDKVHGVLNSKSFSDRGYFVVQKVKETFEDCCEGKRSIGPTLWRWVNLELWFRTFIDRRPLEDHYMKV